MAEQKRIKDAIAAKESELEAKEEAKIRAELNKMDQNYRGDGKGGQLPTLQHQQEQQQQDKKEDQKDQDKPKPQQQEPKPKPSRITKKDAEEACHATV